MFDNSLQPLVGPDATEQQLAKAARACNAFPGMVEATVKTFQSSPAFLRDVPEALATLPQPGDLWPILCGWGTSVDQLKKDVLQLTHATTQGMSKQGQPPRPSTQLLNDLGPCTRAAVMLKTVRGASSGSQMLPAAASTYAFKS